MKGVVKKLRSFRASGDPEKILAQQWVVEGENGEEYILSVKEGQQIEFLTGKLEPGRIYVAEVNFEKGVKDAEKT